jgi:hypothetical protein
MSDRPIIRQRVQCFDQLLSWCGTDNRFDTLVQLLADAQSEPFGYALAVSGKRYLDRLNDEQLDERKEL